MSSLLCEKLDIYFGVQVQIVVVNFPFNRPVTLLANLSEFPTSSILIQLTRFQHIGNILGNGAPAFSKEGCHLRLRESNGFFLQPDIYFYVAVWVLIYNDFTVGHWVNFLLLLV
jgi:hypothetical protein